MDSVSLLPPNATSFEHAAAASMQAITELPVPVKAVRDPLQCPAALLPWLAVHHGVDEWDDTWPEAVQRAVIAGSYQDKMRRGTRAAVVQAMTALGVPVTYENAFEYGGRAYCFRLTLGLDGQTPWTQPQAALLVRLVNKTKAKRSFLDSVVMTRATPASQRAIAGIMESAIFCRLTAPTPGPVVQPPARMGRVGFLINIISQTLGA